MLPIAITTGIFVPMFESFLPFLNKGLQFLLLINPATFISIALISFFYFSLKTTAAKLMFLGSSLIISMVVAYFIHKDNLKQNKLKNKNKKIEIDFNDNFIHEEQQEKELTLTKLFKK